MKAVLGLASLAGIAYGIAESTFTNPPTLITDAPTSISITGAPTPEPVRRNKRSLPDLDIFTGSYEWEVMGIPYRMYICHDQDTDTLYWAVANLQNIEYHNEYTEGLHCLIS